MKIELDNAVVYHGSNLDVLPTLPDNSVDSIVTDPPYELGFMGKSWDNSGIAYSVELWTECMRVLKPGGHLLAFGGSRTWHRLAVAIEDAGFEMRDSIAWLYGSGFPKSMDISKQIDKQAGAEREVIGSKLGQPGYHLSGHDGGKAFGKGLSSSTPESRAASAQITSPSTDEALKWQGWGTALKPAFEPVVVARKPVSEKTVAANVLKHGVGGLNIDGSRIKPLENDYNHSGNSGIQDNRNVFGKYEHANQSEPNVQGRWPANIILDPYTAELLDEQSTDLGASRFFYIAKANKRDRNEGCEVLPTKSSTKQFMSGVVDVGNNVDDSQRNFANPTAQNFHPTVKPTSLMEYLIKLVTPEGGTVLDPFTGSGSTGKAALLNGYKFIGIELTEEYLPIIENRLKWANQQHSQTEEETKLF